MTATLLPGGPECPPEVLEFAAPDEAEGPPICIRRGVDAPDGDVFEVWDLAERTGELSATYRLTRIDTRR